ncbi:MAG TPA: hypothetical protein VML75_18630 [Kofleriaceae bacterium]|nr:hypothetical protein [Kofleriaceae bacterium]
MHHRCRWLSWALIAVMAACGSPRAAPTAPTGPGFATDDAPALRYLYRDTVAVVLARSPREVDRQLGWGVIASALGRELPLDELSDAGIDLDRPVGVAAIDPSSGTVAAFAQVTDGGRALAWVTEQSRDRGVALSPSRSAGADILLPDSDLGLAVVRRGDSLIVITTEGPPSVRDLAAVRVASLDAGDSIAETEGFRRVMPAVPAAAALAAFIDLERLTTVMAGPTDAELQVRDLIAESEHRLRHATGQDRVSIEHQLEILRTVADASTRQRELSTRVVGALGGVGLGASFGATEVMLHAVSSPAPGTLPDRLLGRTERPLRLSQAVDAAPLLLIEATAEPRALLELLDLWLGARGGQRATIDAAVQEATGRDLGHDLYDNLSGELGVAITADGPLSLDPDVLRDRLELLASAGVRHTDRAAQLVAAVGDGGGSGRARMAWPGFKPLHLAVVAGQLVATTDPAAIDRLAGASAPVSASARIVLDGWLVALLGSREPPAPRRVEQRPDGDPTPLSPRYQALAAELEQAQNQLAERVADHARTDLERRLALGAQVGTLTATIRRQDTLVLAEGTLRSLAGTPKAAIEQLARGLGESRDARARFEADRAGLEATINRLAKELDRTRAADIQAAP